MRLGSSCQCLIFNKHANALLQARASTWNMAIYLYIQDAMHKHEVFHIQWLPMIANSGLAKVYALQSS